jgi:membrane protein DedA with SNARE-associated domain
MHVEQLVQQYGYPIILLGTLFEGQPIMLFGGFAAHRGYLDLVPWVILAGAVGNFLGFQAWFLAGRKFGRPLIDRRPQWAKRVEKVQEWLGRYESLLIIAIRFMPGFDTVGTVAIGMSRVSAQRFTVLNALGALFWAAILASGGYLLGNLLQLVLGDLTTVEKPLLIGIVVLTVVWVVYRQGKNHLSGGLLAAVSADTVDDGVTMRGIVDDDVQPVDAGDRIPSQGHVDDPAGTTGLVGPFSRSRTILRGKRGSRMGRCA